MEEEFTTFENVQKWLVDDRGVPKPVAVKVAQTLFEGGYTYPSSLLNIPRSDLDLLHISRPHKNMLINYLQQQQQEPDKHDLQQQQQEQVDGVVRIKRIAQGENRQPPKKKLRTLQESAIKFGEAVKLIINSEEMLNPLEVESINYFGRHGLQEVFQELVDDQTGKQHFNISLVGPPGIGKSNLVFAAAEHITFQKKKNVLWVGRRVAEGTWKVKLFSKGNRTPGELLEYKTTETSLTKILRSIPENFEVLVLDAPTKANSPTGQAGADAFGWTGLNERMNGRRVIHVSSSGSYANKQTIRDTMKLREVSMSLFTRDHYIQSLHDPVLKKQVCRTLQIEDPNTVSNEDLVDQKFFYSGINALWFYNRSFEEIKNECTEIIERLDDNDSSPGSKNDRTVNSAVATIRGEGRLIRVYTSCYLAKSIGSSKGSYHEKFLKLFPFVKHTLGTGTSGDVFESDFRFHLEQCHSLRESQVALMGNKAEAIQVYLGRRCHGDKSKLWYPAGKIKTLPDPPADILAHQRTKLSPTSLDKNLAQWFIPNSMTQPFLDFMVLTPQSKPQSNGSWLLVVIQNTVAKTHSADTAQLKRVVGGLLMDGFVLQRKIIIVYVIEDCKKGGAIASDLQGSSLSFDTNDFQLEVVHSVYARIAAVPN